MIGAFHFINRIADQLHVDPEALPEGLRRFEPVRRLGVRIAAGLLRRMDLRIREYRVTYEEALANHRAAFEHAMGRPLAEELAPLRSRPRLIEAIALALAERDSRSTLDRETIARIHGTVEAALPTCLEETEGFHARPADPVEAFAFVGTRYAYRTTPDMIEALRKRGYDDLGVLDLAIAVADANQWARMHRLIGLTPELFRIDAGAISAPAVA